MALDLARFPKLARNLGRVAEIVRVLARYGLADWVARVDARLLHRLVRGTAIAPLADASHPARIRLVLTALGTTFITPKIHSDLAILAELARLAEEYLSELRPYRPVAVVAEFQRVLRRELDFRRELRHLQLFNRQFARDDGIKFPVPLPELSTSR